LAIHEAAELRAKSRKDIERARVANTQLLHTLTSLRAMPDPSGSWISSKASSAL
jgi:hypothetical protein